MSGFVLTGYTIIFLAAAVAVEVWYPGQWAEEEVRGSPASFTLEGPDGFPIEVFEPSVIDSALYDLRQRLASGVLKSYVVLDDGNLVEILPRYWVSRQADIHLDSGDVDTSHWIPSTEGIVLGRTLSRLDELRNLLALEEGKAAVSFTVTQTLPTTGPATPTQRERTKPRSGLAREILDMLYPDGVPSQTQLSNKELERAITDKSPKGNKLSRDSILRAAGRRK
jgi:hypothetical protein